MEYFVDGIMMELSSSCDGLVSRKKDIGVIFQC